MPSGLFIILMVCCAIILQAQPNSTSEKGKYPHSRFVGKYQMEAAVIQFAIQNDVLVLVVPGAPIQKLKSIGKNRFKSTVFIDQIFAFEEESGKVTGVVSADGSRTVRGEKISDQSELESISMDSILPLRKSTRHFLFLYGPTDSITVDSIAIEMERSYNKILSDFKLKRIPNVAVRIYPDLTSFHKGINWPNAPDQVLATAFGKDDIRMVSPTNAGPERWMLAYVAPHEFTHCVHLNIDYSPNNPRWLWEGVAQYEAGWFFDPNDLEIIRKKQFPSLADLNNGMEYMLGYVIIEAIKELWGFDTVIRLIKNQGDVEKVLKIEGKLFEEKIFGHIHQKYIKT